MNGRELHNYMRKISQKAFGQNREGRPGRGRRGSGKPASSCWCPSCEKEFKHKLEEPCRERKCPECGERLIRK